MFVLKTPGLEWANLKTTLIRSKGQYKVEHMKKIIILQCFLLAAVLIKAQKNNPYNQRGQEYAQSIALITSDFQNGKVKELTQETMNNYAKLIPLKTNPSLEVSTRIVQTLKSPGFNIEQFIDQSSLSPAPKQLMKEVMAKMQTAGAKEFHDFMNAKVNEIQAARISEQEKEFSLSYLAMVSNLPQPTFNGVRRSSGCYIYGPDGGGYYEGNMCIVMGIGLGFILGFEICGFYCGLGGAVIGGILGSLS